MNDEERVRDLLTKAATTVPVSPGGPIARPERRTWVVVAGLAAAAVVVASVGVVLMTRDGGVSSGPPIAVSPTPSPDVFPVTITHVPSVFGYDAVSAEAMLTDLGLTVERRDVSTCETSGRAVRTRPSSGRTFEPGQAVVLFVTQPNPAARCVTPPDAFAWTLLDFANGRGAAPAFADEVTVQYDGTNTTLTGVQAADLATWPADSALGALAQATTAAGETRLFVGGVDKECGAVEGLAPLSGRPSELLTLGHFENGFQTGCTTARVYSTDGEIDGLVVGTSVHLGPPGGFGGIEAGDRLLAFARGESDSLGLTQPISLYLGNEFVKNLSPAQAEDRSAWDVCPAAGYAERACPLSAVDTLASYGGKPSINADFHSPMNDVCLVGTELTTDRASAPYVAITPSDASSCIDDFVVQIWTNDAGEIAAVNLLLGSP